MMDRLAEGLNFWLTEREVEFWFWLGVGAFVSLIAGRVLYGGMHSRLRDSEKKIWTAVAAGFSLAVVTFGVILVLMLTQNP